MHLHRALIGLAVAVLHRGIAKNPEPVEATRDVSGTKVDYGKADPYSVKDIGNEADDSDYDPYEVDASEYDDYFMEEWETVMRDFTPDLLVTVPVASRSDEFFYEDVTATGTLIRGAYFVIDSLRESAKSGVDFAITDPEGAIIYERKDKVEGVFTITANKTGTYSIMIGNHKWMTAKQVTVLMGVGEQNSLKTKDLSSLTDGIVQIENSVKEIQSESSYLWIKQKSHMKEVTTINRKMFWYHMMQLAVLAAVASVQIYYIRGLLSSRRLF